MIKKIKDAPDEVLAIVGLASGMLVFCLVGLAVSLIAKVDPSAFIIFSLMTGFIWLIALIAIADHFREGGAK